MSLKNKSSKIRKQDVMSEALFKDEANEIFNYAINPGKESTVTFLHTRIKGPELTKAKRPAATRIKRAEVTKTKRPKVKKAKRAEVMKPKRPAATKTKRVTKTTSLKKAVVKSRKTSTKMAIKKKSKSKGKR